MTITQQEHWAIFKNWCMMNKRKMSDAKALKAFCEFSKRHYQVVKFFR